jgi:UDPglucose 6-dehydrogenase
MPAGADRRHGTLTPVFDAVRALDLERLKREIARSVVVDLRNIYRSDEMAALGFIYESVGLRRTSQFNIVEPSRSPAALNVK